MNQSKEAMKKADVEEFGTNLQNKNWIGSDFFLLSPPLKDLRDIKLIQKELNQKTRVTLQFFLEVYCGCKSWRWLKGRLDNYLEDRWFRVAKWAGKKRIRKSPN